MLSIIDKAYPVFSPPCGDCTQAHRREVMDFLFFAPLRGWYRAMKDFGWLDVVFAPLRGWYNSIGYNKSTPNVFAPLRGLYFGRMDAIARPEVFAPLRGLYFIY